MISKGYHYVINLGIVSNFYVNIDISMDPVYPGFLEKDLSQQVNSGESGFSLLHRSSSPLSTMSFDIYKFFVFYFHYPCLFYTQYNLSLQVFLCFHFLHFYLHILLQCFKKPPPSLLVSGALYPEGVQTKNSHQRKQP